MFLWSDFRSVSTQVPEIMSIAPHMICADGNAYLMSTKHSARMPIDDCNNNVGRAGPTPSGERPSSQAWMDGQTRETSDSFSIRTVA